MRYSSDSSFAEENGFSQVSAKCIFANSVNIFINFKKLET